jgi:hypothetical protein
LRRIDRRNVRLDLRWTAGTADDIRKYATGVLTPEVILASGGSVVGPLLQETVPCR